MLQERDTSLWEAVKNRAKEVAGKIRAIVDAYKDERMDSREGKVVANMKEILPQLEELYAEGLADSRGEAVTDSDAGTKKPPRMAGLRILCEILILTESLSISIQKPIEIQLRMQQLLP